MQYSTKDSASMVFNLRDIANGYRCLDQNDSSLYYLRKAYYIAKVLRNYDLMAMVQSQMASLYIELEKYDLARKFLQPSLDSLDIPSRSGIFSMASKLYHKTGSIDSAIYYYTELLKCGTIMPSRQPAKDWRKSPSCTTIPKRHCCTSANTSNARTPSTKSPI